MERQFVVSCQKGYKFFIYTRPYNIKLLSFKFIYHNRNIEKENVHNSEFHAHRQMKYFDKNNLIILTLFSCNIEQCCPLHYYKSLLLLLSIYCTYLLRLIFFALALLVFLPLANVKNCLSSVD